MILPVNNKFKITAMDSQVENCFSQLENLCKTEIELKPMYLILQKLAELMKNDKYRSCVNKDHWQVIECVSKIYIQLLNKGAFSENEYDFLAEYFRFLRNCCAGSLTNQELIINSKDVLNCCMNTLSTFLHSKSDKERTVLKCCLQTLGNIVCVSAASKPLVWKIFQSHNAFKYLFKQEDRKIVEYAMMVFYNCMTEQNCNFLIISAEGHDILIDLIDSLCLDLIDWGILFLELMVKHEQFLTNCYSVLPINNRLLILDIIAEQLNSIQDNTCYCIPYTSLNFLKNLYIQYVMDIVKICNSESNDKKAAEIVKLLCVLCAASICDLYNSILKTSRELLEISLDTLKCIHFLGKKSSNAFTCISSLKVLNQSSRDEIESQASYCFKKNLIRLIGNLCYNCRENQDLVRQLDGIPLLLDCCNLDARNPFIMQWCILAVRNILEKNSENQAVLAGMSVSGDLVDSALLRELGFQVHNENGKFVLKSISS